MSFKRYIFIIALATVVAWVGWLAVLLTMAPQEPGALVGFYGSLFLALTGVFTLIGGWWSFSRGKPARATVTLAFRHALWLSLVVNSSLFLQSQRLLNLFNTLLLVAFVATIEFLVLSLETV